MGDGNGMGNGNGEGSRGEGNRLIPCRQLHCSTRTLSVFCIIQPLPDLCNHIETAAKSTPEYAAHWAVREGEPWSGMCGHRHRHTQRTRSS